LLTVTVTVEDVPTFPARSYAFVIKPWLPLAALAVFQLALYGAAVDVLKRVLSA
jgi:hypothetical protein